MTEGYDSGYDRPDFHRRSFCPVTFFDYDQERNTLQNLKNVRSTCCTMTETMTRRRDRCFYQRYLWNHLTPKLRFQIIAQSYPSRTHPADGLPISDPKAFCRSWEKHSLEMLQRYDSRASSVIHKAILLALQTYSRYDSRLKSGSSHT